MKTGKGVAVTLLWFRSKIYPQILTCMEGDWIMGAGALYMDEFRR